MMMKTIMPRCRYDVTRAQHAYRLPLFYTPPLLRLMPPRAFARYALFHDAVDARAA